MYYLRKNRQVQAYASSLRTDQKSTFISSRTSYILVLNELQWSSHMKLHVRDSFSSSTRFSSPAFKKISLSKSFRNFRGKSCLHCTFILYILASSQMRRFYVTICEYSSSHIVNKLRHNCDEVNRNASDY